MSTTEASDTKWAHTARWQKRYREVLGAAATVFADKGYAGASTRDIAELLQVRQASLYYYFHSKEAALAAICELGVKDFIANLREILDDDQLDAISKIRKAIANHLSPLRTRPEADFIKVFVAHRHELPPGPRQQIAALAKTYQSLVEMLFIEGMSKGDLRDNLHPQLTTLAFLGLCNSVLINRSLPKRSTIDAIIDEYSEILVQGLAKKAPAMKSRQRKVSKPSRI